MRKKKEREIRFCGRVITSCEIVEGMISVYLLIVIYKRQIEII